MGRVEQSADEERNRPFRMAGTSIPLIAALPDIASTVPPEDRARAERVLMMPSLEARDQDLAAALTSGGPTVFDFVIVEGIVLKETTFASRTALELLGPGDVLAPPLTAARQVEARAVSRYLAHGHVLLAVLDERFRQAARLWSGLSDILYDRLGRQTHRASMHLAMLHLARVEDRLLALFADLAERFGRVTADGILIDLPLTHEIIGRLVASRRPTVTLALQSLGADGVLTRLEDGRWNVARSAIEF